MHAVCLGPMRARLSHGLSHLTDFSLGNPHFTRTVMWINTNVALITLRKHPPHPPPFVLNRYNQCLN